MQGLVPDEEENDAAIIAESALMGASILLSSDAHLLDAQRIAPGRLQKLLCECEVDGDKMVIAKPKEIVRQFMRRR